MKKLDLRTMLTALAIFALGYGVCLAMPPVKATIDDTIIVDRLLVNDYIAFGDEVRLYGFYGKLVCSGGIEADGFVWARDHDILASKDAIFLDNLKKDATILIDSSCILHNIVIDGDTVTGNESLVEGLNAEMLAGHSIEDFMLKEDFIQRRQVEPLIGNSP